MLELSVTDFSQPAHGTAFLDLLDHYACDPMGGAAGLSSYARQHLIERLSARTDFVSILAFEKTQAVGLINAFEGFSTFAAQPLLNIHDLVVHAAWRRLGIGKHLLAALEALARERGCCKLTLEVLEGNRAARAAYRHLGFAGYELDPQAGKALFMEKKLSSRPP